MASTLDYRLVVQEWIQKETLMAQKNLQCWSEEWQILFSNGPCCWIRFKVEEYRARDMNWEEILECIFQIVSVQWPSRLVLIREVQRLAGKLDIARCVFCGFFRPNQIRDSELGNYGHFWAQFSTPNNHCHFPFYAIRVKTLQLTQRRYIN
jgi:hypothetical protein